MNKETLTAPAAIMAVLTLYIVDMAQEMATALEMLAPKDAELIYDWLIKDIKAGGGTGRRLSKIATMGPIPPDTEINAVRISNAFHWLVDNGKCTFDEIPTSIGLYVYLVPKDIPA